MDLKHARPARLRSDRALDPRHRLLVTFDERLEPAIGQIPHVRGDPLPDGDLLREVSEPHTLDAAGDVEPTGDAHGNGELYRIKAFRSPVASRPRTGHPVPRSHHRRRR